METLEECPENRMLSFCNIKNYLGICILNIFIKGLGYTLISSYFMYFYQIFLGVPAIAISVVLSAGIILDGVSDVAMGSVLDRVYTKHGKARHWMFWMAIPLGLTMGLMFFAPANAPTSVKVVYAFILYNLYCCCMTAVRIPSQTLVSLCSDNDKVRTFYAWSSSAGSTLAMSITGIVLSPMLLYFGKGMESAYGYRMTLLIFAVSTTAAVFLCGLLFHEKRDGDYWKSEREFHKSVGRNTDLLTSFIQIIRNKYYDIYFIFHFMESAVYGAFNAVLAYFCAYVLGDAATASLLLMASSVPQFIGQILALPLFHFIDLTRVCLLGTGLMLVGCVTGKMFGVSSLMLLCAGLAIRSLGLGMINGCRGGLVPRIVDYGEWKYGIRQDGMSYGGTSVLDKVTSAIITLIVGACLTATGFSGEGIPGADTIQEISFIFLDIPLICNIIAFITFLFFDLDHKKIKRMRKQISQRKRGIYSDGRG